MNAHRKPNIFLLLGIIGWLAAIGVGLYFVLDYENTPGAGGESFREWPAESRLSRTSGLPTLVLMVHPHCPCSRATIGELALLMAEGKGLVAANVVFVKPKSFPEEWEKTDLWSSASMIPGVRVSVDEEGVEAQRFGSKTSGQVMLYGDDGHLLFSGGITASRGHSGDNAGRTAILSLLSNGTAEQATTPVFGCPLFGKASNTEISDSCHALQHN